MPTFREVAQAPAGARSLAQKAKRQQSNKRVDIAESTRMFEVVLLQCLPRSLRGKQCAMPRYAGMRAVVSEQLSRQVRGSLDHGLRAKGILDPPTPATPKTCNPATSVHPQPLFPTSLLFLFRFHAPHSSQDGQVLCSICSRLGVRLHGGCRPVQGEIPKERGQQ